MKNIILALSLAFILNGCNSNNESISTSLNNEIKELRTEIDSLKGELKAYKSKYGELKKIDAQNNKFGIWEMDYYVDDFGEPTKEGYLKTSCTGLFSNSATTNSELGVKFLIDKSDIRIQLYEYNRNHPIKGEGFLKFKAKRADGEILEFQTYNSERGDNTVIKEYYKKLIYFLQKGGEIKFIAENGNSYSISEYEFVLNDPTYIKEALESI